MMGVSAVLGARLSESAGVGARALQSHRDLGGAEEGVPWLQATGPSQGLQPSPGAGCLQSHQGLLTLPEQLPITLLAPREGQLLECALSFF